MLAPYGQPNCNITAESTHRGRRRRELSGESVTAAPGLEGFAIDLQERMVKMRDLLERVPTGVDPDRYLSVLQARLTGEHSIVAIGRDTADSPNGFLAFAEKMFPDSRSFTRDEERQYNALLAPFYDDVEDDLER